MNLSYYLQILWRRKLIIIVTALVATITVTVGQVSKPQMYTTSATIRIPTVTSGSQDYVSYDLNYTDRIMNTYVAIATSGPVLAELRERLGVSASKLSKVTAKALTDTELLQLTVQSADPKLAQDAANILADIMVSQRTTGNRLSIVQPAGVPQRPGLVDAVLPIVMGLFVGLLGGAGLALLYDGVDVRVHTEDEIVALTELPVLATLPAARRRAQTGKLADIYPHRECFVRLATNVLMHKTKAGGAMSLIITSANPQEGKSTIIANLALTIAKTGQPVILIDADMRRPTQHTFWGLPLTSGLSELLTGHAALKDVLQHTEIPNLDLISSGLPSPDPNVLLGSDAMRNLLETLKSQASVVLIDTPAYLAVADTTALSILVDGVILVVSRGDTRRKDILEIKQELVATGSNLLGLIINRAKYDVPRPYRNYYKPSE